jgi:hypothetical protein
LRVPKKHTYPQKKRPKNIVETKKTSPAIIAGINAKEPFLIPETPKQITEFGQTA